MGEKSTITVENGKQAIVAYCVGKGLRSEMIDFFSKEWSYKTGDVIAAFMRSSVAPQGLTNDMDTLPDVVLYYDENGVVHETEHTKKIAISGRIK